MATDESRLLRAGNMTILPPAQRLSGNEPHGRRLFLRDVLVLQLKLMIGNLHNFVLIPATMLAAALDLVVKSGRHGSRFYRVLEWGREAEEAIGLYSALDHREEELKEIVSIEAVLSGVQDAIVREHEKGGTVSSMKVAVDRLLDQLRAKTADSSPVGSDAAQSAVQPSGLSSESPDR